MGFVERSIVAVADGLLLYKQVEYPLLRRVSWLRVSGGESLKVFLTRLCYYVLYNPLPVYIRFSLA